jgi:hypothetical protein
MVEEVKVEKFGARAAPFEADGLRPQSRTFTFDHHYVLCSGGSSAYTQETPTADLAGRFHGRCK